MTEQQLGQWITALQSGQYVQMQGTLHDGYRGHCCLGVLADINNMGDGWGYLVYPIDILPEPLDIIVDLNDNGTVDQYARVICELQSCPELYITG